MHKTIAKTALILSLSVLCACSEKPLSEQMMRSQMLRYPDAAQLDFMEGTLKWNYTTGLELRSFLDVYLAYGGQDILEYVDGWYDRMISEDGSILTYKVERYSTDHICPAKTLFALYDLTGKEKYRKAIKLIKTQIDGQPRTSAGAFWHKKIYPYQVWLDGVYMAEPFYAEYVSRYCPEEAREEAWRDIINEFDVAATYTFDPATGLYRHACDESRTMPWADHVTGQSAHCWGRALGWYCMAIVDVLDFIPADIEGRDRLVARLQDIIAAIRGYADPETGLWYQVLDQPGREGNYLESTCSAMFCYAMLKGVRMGYLDKKLLPRAKQTYKAMCRQFIRTEEDGTISITDCCSVAGLGGKNMRMGDYPYYLSEPVRNNDPKGTGPFIWASLEMERLK